jgi:hypothetical protein
MKYQETTIRSCELNRESNGNDFKRSRREWCDNHRIG